MMVGVQRGEGEVIIKSENLIIFNGIEVKMFETLNINMSLFKFAWKYKFILRDSKNY